MNVQDNREMGENPMRSRRCKGGVTGGRCLFHGETAGTVKRHCMNSCGKEPVMRMPEPEDLPFLRDYKSCGAQFFIIEPLIGERKAEYLLF